MDSGIILFLLIATSTLDICYGVYIPVAYTSNAQTDERLLTPSTEATSSTEADRGSRSQQQTITSETGSSVQSSSEASFTVGGTTRKQDMTPIGDLSLLTELPDHSHSRSSVLDTLSNSPDSRNQASFSTLTVTSSTPLILGLESQWDMTSQQTLSSVKTLSRTPSANSFTSTSTTPASTADSTTGTTTMGLTIAVPTLTSVPTTSGSTSTLTTRVKRDSMTTTYAPVDLSENYFRRLVQKVGLLRINAKGQFHRLLPGSRLSPDNMFSEAVKASRPQMPVDIFEDAKNCQNIRGTLTKAQDTFAAYGPWVDQLVTFSSDYTVDLYLAETIDVISVILSRENGVIPEPQIPAGVPANRAEVSKTLASLYAQCLSFLRKIAYPLSKC